MQTDYAGIDGKIIEVRIIRVASVLGLQVAMSILLFKLDTRTSGLQVDSSTAAAIFTRDGDSTHAGDDMGIFTHHSFPPGLFLFSYDAEAASTRAPVATSTLAPLSSRLWGQSPTYFKRLSALGWVPPNRQ